MSVHKITAEDRERLLALRARGEKIEVLVALFGVSRSTVCDYVYPNIREARNRRKRERRRAA